MNFQLPRTKSAMSVFSSLVQISSLTKNSQRARRYWHRYWHCMECSGFFWDYSFLLTCVLLSTLLFLQMPQNTYIHQAKTVITDEFFVPLRHALSRCHPSPTVGENGSDRQFFGCVPHVWKGRKCGERGLDIVQSSYEKTMLYISCIQWFCHPVAQCSFVNAKHIAGTIFNLHLRLVNVVTVTEKNVNISFEMCFGAALKS